MKNTTQNANQRITKCEKSSGRLAAGTINGAMGGEYSDPKLSGGGAVRVPLSVYVRDPLLTVRMNSKQLGILVREALYRIRILERRETVKFTPADNEAGQL